VAHVLLERFENGRLDLVLNRPRVHNALNPELLEALTHAFRQAAAREDVRYVVLSAEGPSFCAGADLEWMRQAASASFEENRQDASRVFTLLEAVAHCPKPVVARVHGAALGGGVGLVAACDLAVATPDATFGLTEVRLGLVPAMILPFLLRKVHRSALPWAILTASRFSAHRALEVGLVHAVSDEPDRVLAEWGEAFRAAGPQALAEAKRLLRTLPQLAWDQAREEALRSIAAARVGPEGQEGMRAFLERRKPGWSGP
jgi:methylglutaconyl-CoA hydratase